MLDGMSTPSLIEAEADERGRVRRFLGIIGLLVIVWILVPYLVRIPFGSEAANGAAAISLLVWLLTVLGMTQPRRCHLSKRALSRVYVFVAICFVVGLS